MDSGAKAELDLHLAGCPLCRGRLEDVRRVAESVRNALDSVPPGDSAAIDSASALAAFRARTAAARVSHAPWWSSLRTWYKPLGGAVAAGLLIAGLFSFAPARTWGQRILEMLRVQKVAIVPIDLSAADANVNGQDARTAGKLLAQMISDSVVVTIKPGAPQVVPDRETASRDAGFAVRELSGLGAPQKVLVQGEGAFHTTLNRDRIEDLLNQVSRPDIQIPRSVDGSTIAVHIPKLVRVVYGNCKGAGKPADAAGDCTSFVQVPAPLVSVPPSLDLSALAEAALEVTGMSAADAHAFCQSVDWSSTLVIPVPRRDSTFRTVNVDGVNGTLIEAVPHGRLRGDYALVWIKKGIVYCLSGVGTADRALAAAQSLD
ncbi:MAG: hypothetical protein JOZ43_07370 [Acidobacteriales bacterium]|nr:hypothetical protein [Terriglobales bacterium]